MERTFFNGAVGLMAIAAALAPAIWVNRALRPPARGGWAVELAAALIPVLAGLYVAHPFLELYIVGAGDAYHYVLQASDFIAQARHGVFPVFVGQSVYAFNGNIHTLRTAPYFTYVCGLADLLTAHRLSATAVVHLVILASALGGGASAYLAVRILAPSARLAAALLAGLYLAAPGVAGPLLTGDMVATFMAIPWLPLVFLGLVQTLQRADPRGPLALAVGCLAVVWWAHPPTAAIVTAAFALAVLFRAALTAGLRQTWLAFFLAAAGGAALTAYVFVSVLSMRLGQAPSGVESIPDGLPSLRDALFLPFRSSPGYPTTQEPGMAAPFLVLGCLVAIRPRQWPGLAFAAIAALAAAAFLRIPGVTLALWRAVPESCVAFIQPWPFQRLMPVMAAFVTVWAAASFLPAVAARRRAYGSLCLLLLIPLAADSVELWRYSAWLSTTHTELRPENVELGRSSYLLFGRFPKTYSDGPLEPSGEIRWLDPSLESEWDNAAAVIAAAATAPPVQAVDRRLILLIQPGLGYVLAFEFADGTSAGELTMDSGAVHWVWRLPHSGRERAFGSGAGANHELLVMPSSLDGKELMLNATVPGVSVRVYPFRESELPLRVESLIPLVLRVRAPAAGFVETPRMSIPGYRAAVDGRIVGTSVSPDGLVLVPVPAGASLVRLDYPGPPGLAVAFWLSVGSLVFWPGLTAWLYRKGGDSPLTGDLVRRHHAGTVWWRLLASAVALAAVAAAANLCAGLAQDRANAGLVASPRIVLKLRFVPPVGAGAEPLVSWGSAGAADVLSVRYLSDRSLCFVYDCWGPGEVVSSPVAYQPGKLSTLEVALPPAAPAASSGRLQITLDGRRVVDAPAPPRYPARARTLVFGANPAGASTCGPAFTGSIESVDPAR